MNIWIVNHYAIPPSMGGLVRHYYFSKYLQKKLERRLVNYYEIIKDIEGIKTNISHGFEKGKFCNHA